MYRSVKPSLTQLAAHIVSWSHLDEAIREDRPVRSGDVPLEGEIACTELASYPASWFASVAERASDHLVVGTHSVLDIGGTTAPWSLALAARNPALRVTVVQLPEVLPMTRRIVTRSGYDSQFDFLVGDLVTVDLGSSGYDLAMVGNACHLLDPTMNRRLLARLFQALHPGGMLAILEALPNERLDGPRPVVLYALSLLLSTHNGQLYPFSTYMGWFREAGYETIERIEVSVTPPVSLIKARKPVEEQSQ